MSIRPIDLKMTIPKTQEISKTEQDNKERHNANLQNQVAEQEKKFQRKLKKVNQSDNIEKNRIRNDEKDRNNQSNEDNSKENKKLENDNKKEDKEKEAPTKRENELGFNIDIKV